MPAAPPPKPKPLFLVAEGGEVVVHCLFVAGGFVCVPGFTVFVGYPHVKLFEALQLRGFDLMVDTFHFYTG